MEGTTYTFESETHYSLKEMETTKGSPCVETTYFESETHYSLKEMETANSTATRISGLSDGRKPTTL